MVREVLRKLFRRSEREQEPEHEIPEHEIRISDVRAATIDDLNPSHSDQAAQIGMFS